MTDEPNKEPTDFGSKSFSQEENDRIDLITKGLSMMLAINKVEIQHGLISLSELIILSFVDMARNGKVPLEDVSKFFDAFLDNMRTQGHLVIKAAVEISNKPKDNILDMFLNATPTGKNN